MKIKPVKTKKDYKQALARLGTIFDAKKSTAEGDELEVLSILIDYYEQQHFSIALPDPADAIKFRMEQLGYNQNDLANELIRQLHENLHIPTDVLVQAY